MNMGKITEIRAWNKFWGTRSKFEAESTSDPYFLLAWPPLQIIAVNFFFFQNWGGETFLESASEIFLSSKGELIFFGDISDRFSDLFPRFSCHFHMELKFVRGQIRSADVLPSCFSCSTFSAFSTFRPERPEMQNAEVPNI